MDIMILTYSYSNSKLILCKERNTGYNLRKNDTQDLVPNFSRTDGCKYSFFIRIVNEWNGLPNHIRESNSITTFKKNVLSFIKDNQNIYISICIYFSYILDSGGIPSMAHLHFWLSPSPQLVFLLLLLFYFILFYFFIVVLAYSLVMQWSESVINK